MTSFYINQAYQGYKESKKNILLRSIHPRPSDTNAQSSWEFEELRTIVEWNKNSETKLWCTLQTVFRSGWNTRYLAVGGGKRKCCFDYGYSKENCKVLCNGHKMNILNSSSATIFNRSRIQYESGALDTDFSKTIFSLPSTTDRIEDINRNLNSVNLMPIDIDPSELCENFYPIHVRFWERGQKKNKRICVEGS